MSPPDHTQVPRADVLYVTHCRASYTRKSLPSLLRAVEGHGRVWIWHNGDHKETDSDKLQKIEETWQVVQEYKDHPSIAYIHNSKKNVRLIPAMRWIFSKSQAEFIAKVDDDTIVSGDWLPRMFEAYDDCPGAGILGAWAFMPEDFDEEISLHKIESIGSAGRILRNNWTPGSAFVMRGEVIRELGGVRWRESHTALCCRAARRGWIIGWPIPLICVDHMDDPRSPNAGYLENGAAPLSASSSSQSSEAWQRQLQESARNVQTCGLDRFPDERSRLRLLWKLVRRILPVRLLGGHQVPGPQ